LTGRYAALRNGTTRPGTRFPAGVYHSRTGKEAAAPPEGGTAASEKQRGRCEGPAGPGSGTPYLTVTVAPAFSRASLALSAASLLTFSSSGFGAPSTRSLASLRPRLVSARTSLMTW